MRLNPWQLWTRRGPARILRAWGRDEVRMSAGRRSFERPRGARRARRSSAWLCAALLAACNSFDADLLDKSPAPPHQGNAGGGATDAGTQGPDAGDAATPSGSG